MYRIKYITDSRLADYLKITAGAALMGFALSVFMVPLKIAAGGVSGAATIVHYLTGVRVSVLIAAINIPIFILGILNLHKGFFIRSIYGTAVLSVSAELAGLIPQLTDDVLLACVFGGGITGMGIALVLSSGGTTGGTDILVLVIRKYFPHLSVGSLFLAIDGIIIAAAGIIFSHGSVILYSAAALMISTYVTDTAIEGLKFARLVYIISDENPKICERIYAELQRGVTGIKSVSMYSGAERETLMCVIRKRQLPGLKRIIRDTDPNAFVIICDAKEVVGRGFEVRNI